MANRKFTQEELAEIQRNPFVKSASESKIMFTKEFKESFWKRAQSGEPLHHIISAFGLNPEVLGYRRIKGVYAHLNEQVVEGIPFSDEIRIGNIAKEKVLKKPPASREQAAKITALEHEVLYLKQELEFLKKIISADKEAELKCLLKQRRISSLKSSMN